MRNLVGKYFGVIFTIVHVFYFLKSLINALGFFNIFSNAEELENGLRSLLYTVIHASCIGLGLCLYYGSVEKNRDLLKTFLSGGTMLTAMSLVNLALTSIFSTLTILQMLSWSFQILIFSIVLLFILSFYNDIPSKASLLSSPEGGVVQLDPPRQSVQAILVPLIKKDVDEQMGYYMKRFAALLQQNGASGNTTTIGADCPPYPRGVDCAYDSDSS